MKIFSTISFKSPYSFCFSGVHCLSESGKQTFFGAFDSHCRNIFEYDKLLHPQRCNNKFLFKWLKSVHILYDDIPSISLGGINNVTVF
jgi:hypothetical protein